MFRFQLAVHDSRSALERDSTLVKGNYKLNRVSINKASIESRGKMVFDGVFISHLLQKLELYRLFRKKVTGHNITYNA